MINEALAVGHSLRDPAAASAQFLVVFYEWVSFWPEADGFVHELIRAHVKQFPNHTSSRRMCSVLLKHKRLSRVWLAPNVFGQQQHAVY